MELWRFILTWLFIWLAMEIGYYLGKRDCGNSSNRYMSDSGNERNTEQV